MKQILTCFLALVTGFISGQEITKETIVTAFAEGEKVAVAIEDNDLIAINNLLDTATARELTAFRESEKYESGEYKIFRDVFFYPPTNSYRLTIYASKWIETDSDWGLNDYLFVLELKVEYDVLNKAATITDHRLLDQDSDLKSWWRFFIGSYRDPGMLRDKWAKEFKLVPPPPPPPQTTDWF